MAKFTWVIGMPCPDASMPGEVRQLGETSPAVLACVRVCAYMCVGVRGEVYALCEHLSAHDTSMSLLPGVRFQVEGVVCALSECFGTHGALVWTFTGVEAEVVAEGGVVGEGAVAVRADVRTLTTMQPEVTGEIIPPQESSTTLITGINFLHSTSYSTYYSAFPSASYCVIRRLTHTSSCLIRLQGHGVGLQG